MLKNEKNSYYVKIDKDTHTVPIMTEFDKCDKEFLLLNAEMYLPIGRSFTYIIVKENINNMYPYSYSIPEPTMTEIKNVAATFLENIGMGRLCFLKDVILRSIKEYSDFATNSIIPLLEPYPIGGQTDYNRKNYGWDGKQYGEVTEFKIIGIKINKLY